jgi:long-chain acyl-CoA synthetase
MSRLAGMIRATLALDPAAPALEFERAWRSWGDLGTAARALADALDGAGRGAGTRVGTLMRNRPELVPVMIALFSSGRCLATLNASAPDDALAADIERVNCPVIVGLASDLGRPGVREAIARSGALALVLTGDAAHPVEYHPALTGDDAIRMHSPAPEIAIEMLTSGTTGTPKRIPLPYRNLEKALMGAADFEKGRSAADAPKLRGGVQIVSAPLAHIAGVTAVMNNILAGRRVCLLEKFTVEGFRDAVVRHRPKVAGAPPSALRMIMDADVPREDFSSLLAYRTGTAPLSPDLADAFYQRYGIPVLQNYGATEFAGGAAGWTLDDFRAHWQHKRGSVGRINRGVEARVVDPDSGAELAAGSEGLLELRGSNIGDGQHFVRTTDLAVLDDDGFLFIKGRSDNAIIRGGFKILPHDVAQALEKHPAILECGVCGIADSRLGEVPAAAYIVKAGVAAPGEDELRAFLRARLMPYQVPVLLLAVAELPRTPSMKISLPALKSLLEEAAK